MNDETTSSSNPRSGKAWLAAVLLLAMLAIGSGWGWRVWRAHDAREEAKVADAEQRVEAIEQRLESIRRDQRAQTQRIQDAAATNRVLRDEVLGLSQRGALLEESIAKLSDPNRHGAQALRLDEVEILLSLAEQRLAIADDLAGAKRTYALAAAALEGIDDHRLLNLKQAMAQERSALEAVGEGPRARLAKQLDALAGTLVRLPGQPGSAETQRPRWQQLLAPLVDVRPSRRGAFVAPSDRVAGEAALRIEFSLAHAALERGDTAGFHDALARIDAWLTRLWPDSPALRQARSQLAGLRRLPLRSDANVLGSTLQQLRAMRNAGVTLRAPTASPVPVDGPEVTQ